jgi:aldehyde:ferredoxin oxidoreductase
VNYAVGPRGACHNRGFTIPLEAANRLETKGKGEMVKRIHDMVAVGDSTILCAFGSVGVTSKDTVALLLATTGITWEEKDVFAVGERILNVERLFNVREGMRRKDDTLPQRFLTEPMPSGASKGQVVDLQPMIDEYYRARGWDEQGIPTQDKLRELSLENMVSH